MKTHHVLRCQQLENIQHETLEYLTKRYDLGNQSSLKTSLWLKINTIEFLKNSPSLLQWAQDLNLKIRETAITVINDIEGAKLHIDEPPVVAKVNIPIQNTQNVLNEWYSVPADIIDKIEPILNEFGNPFYWLSEVDLSKCTLLDSIELTTPIVFNSSIAHRVVPQQGCQFPRVVLTVMFFNEPLDYLVV